MKQFILDVMYYTIIAIITIWICLFVSAILIYFWG